MALFNSFTFDGENSLDNGIYISGEAAYNAPERAVEMITVPGRNGAIAMDQGRFENIEVTYPAGCFASDEEGFANKIAEFRNILASRYSYKRLTDTYNPDEFRMALYKSGLEVETAIHNSAGEFDITFDCKPQRWLVSGETMRVFTSNGTITNPTLFDAKPLLVVTGYGDIGIGNDILTIEGTSASQVIYIDCDTQEAWSLSGSAMIPRNDYIRNAGESFPVLHAGSNGIALGTGISRIVVTPRWWRI